MIRKPKINSDLVAPYNMMMYDDDGVWVPGVLKIGGYT